MKVFQIRIQVESETVRGDPAADVNADGSQLRAARPDAGAAFHAPGCDAEIGKRVDQNLFNRAHVEMHVALPIMKIQNGITDDLAGSMISDIASAIGFVEPDSRAREHFRAGQQIGFLAVAPHGDHVRMLDNEKLIGDLAALALFHQVLLHDESFVPFQASQLAQLAAA